MEIEQKLEWLKPERIQKLYDGQKSHFGMNRLFIIGIGRNGVDCALHCMHLTERRFGRDPSKVRFLCIGEEGQLARAEYEGSVPADGDTLPISPEEAIYKYLNNPAKLPEQALDWFDQGLKNYSPAAPAYGLTKRQGGRIALFHYLKQIMKLTADAMQEFSGSDRSLEVILTGNLGDTFFGGMFIDLGYILDKIFSVCPFPVRVNAYLFAADTAALVESDSRDLGHYQANTMIAKSELDRFQLHRKHFTQKYSRTFEVDSDKPPFSSCFLIPAESSYCLTMNTAAEKILNRMEIIFSKDDEAERIVSYNMLRPDDSHDFRYLSCGVSVCEAPVGKIMSFLGIKLFTRLNHTLNENSVSEMALQRYSALVAPGMELVASKSGQLPSLEFDEKSHPAFSVRSIRTSREGALVVVENWLDALSSAVQNGAPVAAGEIADSIIHDCETAKVDFARGPFYAQEIMKKCLADLRVYAAKIKTDAEDMAEQVEHYRDLERAAMRKVKSATLFANKAVEQYLQELKGFAEASAAVATSKPMLAFCQALTEKLNEYYNNTLQKAIDPFEQISVNRGALYESVMSGENRDSCVTDLFSLSDERIRARLEQLADSIQKERLEQYFRETGILSLPEDDERALASAVVKILKKCFEKELSMTFSEMCDLFEVPGGVGKALENCVEESTVRAPVSDDFQITRIICPNAVRKEDIAEPRAKFKGVHYIWNGSVCSQMEAAASICGGVELEKFNGYQQWENMEYAYVNDSLKKHGIRLFS